MSQTESPAFLLNTIQQRALLAGGAGLVLAVLGALFSRTNFFQAYLLAYLFWTHLALGCLGVLMLHHLVGGRWGFAIRRFLEAGALTLPLMGLLFLPLLLGMSSLYQWARPEEVAQYELLQHKQPYLNVPFFIGRTVVYYLIWIGLAYLLNRWSAAQDRTGEPALISRMRNLSTIGMILYILTATFAAFDWMMSLEPKWFSSIYGALFVSGQALAAIALAIILGRLTDRQEPVAAWFKTTIYNDLGNFLLAFVGVWAYMAFSQYLIIWSGNLPEEVTWYFRRTMGGWQWIGLLLILFHFSLPFAILLSRSAKRSAQLMTGLAAFILVMRFVDLFWLTMPAFRPDFGIRWLDIVALVGIGGLWVATYLWLLGRQALIPSRDLRFQEVSVHE